MANSSSPFAAASMLIRKPAALVFQAFLDPAVTTHFWFTKSSGILQLNQPVIWEWEMYHFSTKVVATEIRKDEKIVIDWYTGEEPSWVEFSFKKWNDDSTFVTIKHYDFHKEGDALIAAIRDSTEGFTIVLAGLKAWLEQGIHLNLIMDKFPKAPTE